MISLREKIARLKNHRLAGILLALYVNHAFEIKVKEILKVQEMM